MAGFTRRDFLKGLCAAGVMGVAAPALSSQRRRQDWRAVVLNRDRWLHLYRPATKEAVRVYYYRRNQPAGRRWQAKPYLQISKILRDVEYDKSIRMSPKLIDLLYIIQAYLKANGKPYIIHITSGYRTLEHNKRLRGAASNSLHMQGLAADITVPGIPVSELSKLVKAIGVGGVGIYPRKNFVHVDVGRARTWTGGLFEHDEALFAGQDADFAGDEHDDEGIDLASIELAGYFPPQRLA
ncbi:DUF882 domain-containing protein [Stutzerimonas stutzeri]|uniref:DUF882 domain-containing protein n=1 Tax=Stutzerimonas stutzeri TaxID=316 RepID=UPI001BD15C50|nr:DUF882 domain-containing protein [Stutzerimonas stutzeri]